MVQEEIFKGEWSLPGSSASFTGTLTFDPLNGTKLELLGSLNHLWGPRSHKIILGKTTNGWITLYDTHYESGSSSNETGAVISVYKPMMIFCGYHFENVDDLKFSSVSFHVFNLLEWLNIDGLTERRNVPDYLFDYKRPDSITFNCNEGCEAEIEFSLNGKYLNDYYNIVYDQSCKVTFRYNTRKSYNEILSDIFIFIGFVTLCTYEQSYPKKIVFFDDEIIDEFIQDRLKTTVPKPIECIYRNSFYSPNYKIRKWHQHLIRYDNISSQFASIMPKWFSKSKELEQVIKLLLLSFVNKYEFNTEKFMDAIRALETFHRLNHSNEVIDKGDFDRRIERIVVSARLLPVEEEWLKSKLEFTNEPSLLERLYEMVNAYSFKYFKERVPDSNIFCRQAKNSRNYYTHFNKALAGKALKGKELFDITENLKLLLFSAVFINIGISSDSYDQSVRMLVY